MEFHRRTLWSRVFVGMLAIFAAAEAGPACAGQITATALSRFDFQGIVNGASVSLSMIGISDADYIAANPSDGLVLEYYVVPTFVSPSGLVLTLQGTVNFNQSMGRAAYIASPPNGENHFAFDEYDFEASISPTNSAHDIFEVRYDGQSNLADLVGVPDAFSFAEQAEVCTRYNDFFDGTCSQSGGSNSSTLGSLTLIGIDPDASSVMPISSSDPFQFSPPGIVGIPEPGSLADLAMSLIIFASIGGLAIPLLNDAGRAARRSRAARSSRPRRTRSARRSTIACR